MIKTCIKCKADKSTDEFYGNSGTVDGYTSWCKDCQKASSKRSYRNVTKPKRAKNYTRKKCYFCHKLKYGNHATMQNVDGRGQLDWVCKPCLKLVPIPSIKPSNIKRKRAKKGNKGMTLTEIKNLMS